MKSISIKNFAIYFLLSVTVLMSCYSKLRQPDNDFTNTIKKQASLDSSLTTTLEIIPKKYYFGSLKPTKSLSGSFCIRNIGKNDFQIVSIKSNCNCISTKYGQKKIIYPGDSLKVKYEMNTSDLRGIFQNTVIVIGNCQYGNQTYYFEGTIINQ